MINYIVAFKLKVESYVVENSIHVTASKFYFDWQSVRDCKTKKEHFVLLISNHVSKKNKKRVSLEGSDQKPLLVDLKERLNKYFSEKHLNLLEREKLKNSIFMIYKFV